MCWRRRPRKRTMDLDAERKRLAAAEAELLEARLRHRETRREMAEVRQIRRFNGFGPLLGEVYQTRTRGWRV